MPLYNFTAKDEWQERAGRIEAADPRAARLKLQADGLVVQTLSAVESAVESQATPQGVDLSTLRLSDGDALELTHQVAAIAKAGLPLAAGLRAVQADLPYGRLWSALNVLCARVEAGATQDAVFEATVARLPGHLRGMLVAGMRSGRLTEVLQECLQHERQSRELKRRVWGAIAYPLFIAWLTSIWSVVMLLVVIQPFGKIFADFDTELPEPTASLMWLTGAGKVYLLTALGLILLAPIWLALGRRTSLVIWLLDRLPLVGPLLRAGNLSSFANLLAALLEQSIALPAALRLTADGLSDSDVSAACRRAANRVETGESLATCIGSLRAFPQTLAPIVQWGQSVSSLPEALRAGAQFYRDRMELQVEYLKLVVPPITFLCVITVVVGTIYGLFLPLIKLLQSLT